MTLFLGTNIYTVAVNIHKPARFLQCHLLWNLTTICFHCVTRTSIFHIWFVQ